LKAREDVLNERDRAITRLTVAVEAREKALEVGAIPHIFAKLLPCPYK